MFGRFLPPVVWESRIVRRLRRPAARGVNCARSRRQLVRTRREVVCEYRRALTSLERSLEPGVWRLLEITAVRAGKSPNRRYLATVLQDRDVLTLPFLPMARQEVRQVERRWRLGRIADDGNHDFTGKVLMLRHSEKALLFDPTKSEVLRWSSEGFTEEYFALRDCFAEHVPCVSYRRISRRSPGESAVEEAIIERLTDGLPMGAATAEAAIAGVLSLVTALTCHGTARQDGAAGTSFDWMRSILSGPAALDLESDRHDAATHWLGSAPLIPAHGDLWHENIFLLNGSPICIDLGGLALAPAWSDATKAVLLTLATKTTRSSPSSVSALESALEQHLRAVVPVTIPPDWRSLTLRVAVVSQFISRAAAQKISAHLPGWD